MWGQPRPPLKSGWMEGSQSEAQRKVWCQEIPSTGQNATWKRAPESALLKQAPGRRQLREGKKGAREERNGVRRQRNTANLTSMS